MSIKVNSNSIYNQVELPSYRRDGDHASEDSRDNTNHNDPRSHLARRLFDNDRLDRRLKRHHITCKSLQFMVSFDSTDDSVQL